MPPALSCSGLPRARQARPYWRGPQPRPPRLLPLSVGLRPLVTGSPRPPQAAGQSCAGTQRRWQEAASGPGALPQHQHPASQPPRRRLGPLLGARPGPSSPGQDGPGLLLLQLQVGFPRARGHVGTAGPRSTDVAHARRALLCREALSDAEPALSADVRLTRGRKRSERRLLLLHEELVVAKLR